MPLKNFLSSIISKMVEIGAAKKYKFLESIDDISDNGLYFNGTYLPEEIVTTILSFVEPNEILQCSLVCRKWFNITRSHFLWYEMYERCYLDRPKNLPWYVYYAMFAHKLFDRNLLRNVNGEENFEHWNIVKNYGDSWIVEQSPVGADQLPENVKEFNCHKSCFATSYYECEKSQEIHLSPFDIYIVKTFKPHIYFSEWCAGRADCGCVYNIALKFYDSKYKSKGFFDSEAVPCQTTQTRVRIAQWGGGNWTKVEEIVTDISDKMEYIVFEHMGQDTQFWKGHYGAKMAGAVVKILFNSIPECVNISNC